MHSEIDEIYLTMRDSTKQNLERYMRKMQVLARKQKQTEKGCEKAKESWCLNPANSTRLTIDKEMEQSKKQVELL